MKKKYMMLLFITSCLKGPNTSTLKSKDKMFKNLKELKLPVTISSENVSELTKIGIYNSNPDIISLCIKFFNKQDPELKKFLNKNLWLSITPDREKTFESPETYANNLKIIRILLEAGADPNFKWHNNQSIMCSVILGCLIHNWKERTILDIIKLLMEHNANISTVNPHGATPLYYAIIYGLQNLAKLLYDYKAKLEIPTIENIGELQYNLSKAANGESCVRSIYDHFPKGAEFMLNNILLFKIQTTGLTEVELNTIIPKFKAMFAKLAKQIINGDRKAISMMRHIYPKRIRNIEKSFNYTEKTKDVYFGIAKTKCAIFYVYFGELLPNLMKELKLRINNPDYVNNESEHILSVAVKSRNHEFIRRLGSKENVRIKNINRTTLLHAAAQFNDLKMCKILVDINPELLFEYNKSYSPLHYASYVGNFEVAEFILKKMYEPKRLTVEDLNLALKVTKNKTGCKTKEDEDIVRITSLIESYLPLVSN